MLDEPSIIGVNKSTQPWGFKHIYSVGGAVTLILMELKNVTGLQREDFYDLGLVGAEYLSINNLPSALNSYLIYTD